MDALKTWLVEVALKKMGPSLVKGALAALVGYLAAHQGLLEAWGITSGTWPLRWTNGQQPSGHVILIELDTISGSALVVVTGLIMSLFTAAQHHTVAAVVGKPQSGDVREGPEVLVEGGKRAEDPPKGE